MQRKIILVVCRQAFQVLFLRSLEAALNEEHIPHAIVFKTSYAQAVAHLSGVGFPDFIVTELRYAEGLRLLLHVRQAGRAVPVVLWEFTFSNREAADIERLNGIRVGLDAPGALALLNRYAVTLLHGQRRAP